MDIIERLQKVIEYEGLSVSSFARRIGVGDQTVRGIVVQKRNKPGYDLIYRIAQTFEWLSIEWLITGNGEMVKTKGQSGTEDAYQGISLKELVDYLREKDRRIETLIRENAQLEIMCQNMHLKGAWKVSKGSRQVVFPIGKEPIVFRLLLCLSLFKV